LGKRKSSRRAYRLMKEVYPITQHNDIGVLPVGYSPEEDTLYLEVMPRSAPRWAETAYQFAKQEGMKYDRERSGYGIDGQPRVSYCGKAWVRFLTDFVGGSRVALHIWSQHPSHEEAEEQLVELYRLFKERDGLEPVEVFRKYW
jgi:hypothetical protein